MSAMGSLNKRLHNVGIRFFGTFALFSVYNDSMDVQIEVGG